MALSGSDALPDWLQQPIFIVILGILFTIFAVVMAILKFCFGTFSINKAKRDWQSNNIVKDRYHKLFSTRDNLMFHISWAKSRGELDEARRMMKELDQVDKVSIIFANC